MSTASTIPQNQPPIVDMPPAAVRLSKIADQPLEWLWPERIAIGKLALIVGEPGLGKGFLTVDLAARVSRGTAWPDAPNQRAPLGSVLLLSAEDDLADTMLARLNAADADLDKIATLQEAAVDDPSRIRRSISCKQDLASLEAVLAELSDCRLIVIDPITAYLGNIDGNRNAAVRSSLQPLVELAAAYRVAVVAVTHLNKNSAGKAINRALGALTFVAAARTVWGVVADPEDRTRRLLLPIKSNLALTNQGLRFRIPRTSPPMVPRVIWEAGSVDLSIDEALQPPRRFNLNEQTYRDTENYADIWLRETLSDGPITRERIGNCAKDLSDSQLHRASMRLGVVKMKQGRSEGWIWMLPEHVDQWRHSVEEKTR